VPPEKSGVRTPQHSGRPFPSEPEVKPGAKRCAVDAVWKTSTNFWMTHKCQTMSDLCSQLLEELQLRLVETKRVDHRHQKSAVEKVAQLIERVGIKLMGVRRFEGREPLLE
jgi:hypothetical protein